MSNSEEDHHRRSHRHHHHFDPFNYNQVPHNESSPLFPFLNNETNIPSCNNNQPLLTQSLLQDFNSNESQSPSSYNMSFSEFLHGSMDYTTSSRAFDLSMDQQNHCDLDGLIMSTRSVNGGYGGGDNSFISEKPSTPNSSISSSSNDASIENQQQEEKSIGKIKKKDKQPSQNHGGDDDDKEEGDKSKQVNKAKKKETKAKQPRFAFLTKSEIDHLEDGYRWRKYGQKAVKNSIFPSDLMSFINDFEFLIEFMDHVESVHKCSKSYYKCTYQKCNVKKRVERSYQDPSTVITTYEGQHNHHCPATIRGNAASLLSPFLLASNSLSPATFPSELLSCLLSSNIDPSVASSVYFQNLNGAQHQFHLPDCGPLQDLVPNQFNKK